MSGEWLQLQLPLPILLSSFSISSGSGNGIGGFCFLGSIDGVNWTTVSLQTGVTVFSATVFQVSPMMAYSHYRIVVTNHAYSGQASTSILKLILYHSQEAMSITRDGLVGIGVSRPSQPLEVAGNAMFYGNIYANNLGMFRNKIINGDMAIDQRNLGTAQPSANTTYYVDRWSIYQAITTGALSIQRVGLTSSDIGPFEKGFKYSLKCTVTTAVSNYTYWVLQQCIEGINISDFSWAGSSTGNNVTLSFWFRAGQAGYYNIILRNYNTSAQSWVQLFKVPVANTWAYYSVVIPPPPGTGTQWNSNNNATQLQLQIGSIVKINQSSTTGWSVPGSAPECVSWFTDWLTTVNNYIQLTGVQLEKGSLATPFEFRPLQVELQLCQRYFITYGTGTTNCRLTNGWWQSSTGGLLNFIPPIEMRTVPTFSYSNLGKVVLDGVTWYPVTALSMYTAESSTKYIMLSYTVASSAATTGLVTSWGNGTSGASPVAYFSSELL